jgi:hypothetical protein
VCCGGRCAREAEDGWGRGGGARSKGGARPSRGGVGDEQAGGGRGGGGRRGCGGAVSASRVRGVRGTVRARGGREARAWSVGARWRGVILAAVRAATRRISDRCSGPWGGGGGARGLAARIRASVRGSTCQCCECGACGEARGPRSGRVRGEEGRVCRLRGVCGTGGRREGWRARRSCAAFGGRDVVQRGTPVVWSWSVRGVEDSGPGGPPSDENQRPGGGAGWRWGGCHVRDRGRVIIQRRGARWTRAGRDARRWRPSGSVGGEGWEALSRVATGSSRIASPEGRGVEAVAGRRRRWWAATSGVSLGGIALWSRGAHACGKGS